MDIRYFVYLDHLKRGDIFDICLRGEKDNHTRPLTDELGVQIPPEALGISQPVVRSFERSGVHKFISRKTKMFVIIDKFDKNQCHVRCPCGAEFDDWTTISHDCPECGASDDGI